LAFEHLYCLKIKLILLQEIIDIFSYVTFSNGNHVSLMSVATNNSLLKINHSILVISV
jgi:hypothetical protein